MMTLTQLLFFACSLPLVLALDKDRLEQIRLLHGHDGIDTATVHINYPHSSAMKRLTKREAVENLLPRRQSNFTVKVTLESSGHVLDLQLQPSRLRVDGAVVNVMHVGGNEVYKVRDEGCHYQGFFDEGRGLASVHFCDGVLVGGAHNGHTEYNFHSHRHRLPGETDDSAVSTSTPTKRRESDLDLFGSDESYHTIVSWKDASEDFSDESQRQEFQDGAEGAGRTERRRRQADSGTPGEEGEEEEYDVAAEDEIVAPSEPGDDSVNVDLKGFETPVAEFGVIFDEDFLRDRQYLYPTRRDLVHFLMYKFTGVQALYGNPEITGFNLTIQVKLIYLWPKNPSWYPGSAIRIGRRMGAGSNFSKENAQYKTTDVGALYTSQAPGRVAGMAFVGGACRWKSKTFVTRSFDLNWITESHEFGHTLGMGHVSPGCTNGSLPGNRGFMNSFKHMFLPCYKDKVNSRLQTNALRCLFKQNVNTTNIPPFRFPATFPVLALGLNYHCRTYFRSDAVYVTQDPSNVCGSVLCAVMDESSSDYGMVQVTSGIDASLNGRSCGANGMICLDRTCKLPRGNTTITAKDTVTGTGTWSGWSPYDQVCTSACGVGVRLSARTCCNQERVEACQGPRFRARLCNTKPCPGDELKTELDLRRDRANYTCSLLEFRNVSFSQYLRPYAAPVARKDLTNPTSVESCLVSCALQPRNKSQPSLQRRYFGKVMQVDGTVCGPVNVFDRLVMGVTTRCLRGRCIEFGCDGFSMENRDGKLKDICGVCGGDKSSCNNGQTTVQLANGQTKTIVVLPAGTRDILFAVQPDNDTTNNVNEERYLKLALMDKDDSNVIVPGLRWRFKITTNDKNPLNFAGTYWTTINNRILYAAGPTDRPMKIKVKHMGRDASTANMVIVWRYKLPNPVPPPPGCQNNGVANVTTGGCMCVDPYAYGRQCEFQCHDLCFNGGRMLPNCRCDCKSNPRSQRGRCFCLAGFAGPDCSQCALQNCYHNGTLNTTTCQCQCPEGCDGQPDCSDCSYNQLLPSYKGHYGRGSLEVMAKNPVKRIPADSETSGQPAIYSHTGLVSVLLDVLWVVGLLVGLPVF